jgi:GTP pyrophosphokinase|tara:strand:- start:272 stop:2299 length:2028 start_codon:yes stop_codon:yes gene_type:complete
VVSVRKTLPELADGSVDLAAWSDLLVAERPHLERDEILQTCLWLDDVAAESLPQGLELAEMVAQLRLDQASVLASICYHAWRKLLVNESDLIRRVGPEVGELTLNVGAMATSSLLQISAPKMMEKEHRSQVDNVRKMLISLVNDVRVAVIKLAERVLVLRHAKAYEPARRTRIAEEAAAIFAPLADRLGMWQLKWELEDLSLRYLREDIYLGIAKQLSNKRQERESQIQELAVQFSELLAGHGLRTEVRGRAKNIFSIWRKMQKKSISIDQVYDVRAIRIIVDSLADCYAVLGIIHTHWQHIPSEFDDYIAAPKENGYQSIHTAIAADDGLVLEVQIRTRTMHEDAELGVCAHWAYKSGERQSASDDESFSAKMDWLRQVLEWHEDLGDTEDLVSLLRQRISEERIFVSTPKGHVLDLSAGATVLDFAYRVHTDLGHSCIGGVVNGMDVPLYTELKTGQQVRVLRDESGEANFGPYREWLEPSLGFVRTHRAKAKIVTQYRSKPANLDPAIGLKFIQSLVASIGLDAWSDTQLEALSESAEYADVNLMLGSVSSGEQSHISLLAEFLENQAAVEKAQILTTAPKGLIADFPRRMGVSVNALNRHGLLSDITQLVTSMDLQILAASGEVMESVSQAQITLEVELQDWRQYFQLVSRVGYLQGVESVVRKVLASDAN